jgi:MYXO-CTERM domain-containing protein
VVGSFTLFSTVIVAPDPGCGCDASGDQSPVTFAGGLALFAMGALLRRRRRR